MKRKKLVILIICPLRSRPIYRELKALLLTKGNRKKVPPLMARPLKGLTPLPPRA